jgi:uncharacterized protein DUF5681
LSTERKYTVGKGKPPERTRFQKGQSGNPKGRPPNSKNSTTLLNEALSERVVITENGQRRTITMKQLIIKRFVNKAASGDLRSIQLMLLSLIPLGEAALESARSRTADTPLPPGLSDEDKRARTLEIAKVLKEIGYDKILDATSETQSAPVATENSNKRGTY